MKKVLAIVIVVFLLAAMTPVSLAAGATVYVTVSVNGKLEVAAQPVTVDELTVQSALIAAHVAFYPEGESGFAAGIDPTWNMYLISKFWGVPGTPYVIVNGAPLGADASQPATADVAPIKDGDNLIISISGDPSIPALAIALSATVADGSATVTAKNWVLDFTTFTYSSISYAGAPVIDPVTGESLGTTDDKGSITIPIPESGTVAIDGLAAINIGAAAIVSEQEAEAPARDYSIFGGEDGRSLLLIVIVGLALAIPLGIVVFFAQRREIKNRGVKFANVKKVKH